MYGLIRDHDLLVQPIRHIDLIQFKNFLFSACKMKDIDMKGKDSIILEIFIDLLRH